MLGLSAGIALALAFANGANDMFKGVATLFGSGTARYRGALAWATVTTLAGSITALALGAALARAFTGFGLIPASLAGPGPLLACAGLGAAMTVGAASRIGSPVSTTHALLGGLFGAGVVASSGAIRYGVLVERFALPLLLSPLLAAIVTAMLYPALSRTRKALGIEREMCLCVDEPVAVSNSGGAHACATAVSRVHVAPAAACEARYTGMLIGVDAQGALDKAHLLSAGLVSFARGLNDTPKIAALLLGGSLAGFGPAIVAVAIAMALGGWWGARRVAETMSFRITALNHGQGFTANLVTASLVIAASLLSLPVSMTHVSVGALVGVGTVTGEARWTAIRGILLAWGLTLPCAAVLAAAVYATIGRFHP